jgi:Ni,Fe-hydrogenase I small subunit
VLLKPLCSISYMRARCSTSFHVLHLAPNSQYLNQMTHLWLQGTNCAGIDISRASAAEPLMAAPVLLAVMLGLLVQLVARFQ